MKTSETNEKQTKNIDAYRGSPCVAFQTVSATISGVWNIDLSANERVFLRSSGCDESYTNKHTINKQEKKRHAKKMQARTIGVAT